MYTINFNSLVAPIAFKKTEFKEVHRKNLSKLNNKALFKRSYTILTWFYYLTFISLKNNRDSNITIFVKPITKRIFTNVKAPMAHKNNSKEQYQFKFYAYVISFRSDGGREKEFKNESIFRNFLFLWITKKNFFFLETNTFFLKSYLFFSSYNDSFFFKIM